MKRYSSLRHRIFSLPAVTATLVAAAAVILATGWVTGTVQADDTNLVRENTAEPFVFFLIDTSSSMVLDINGNPVPRDGDDPQSRIYQVKKTLYTVLEDELNVNFGWATYNQDAPRVWAKHWLYRPVEVVDESGTWPSAVDYPQVAAPDTAPDDMVFGRAFSPIVQVTEAGNRRFVLADSTLPAGTCENPLAFTQERQTINRFAKLGEPGAEGTTEIWIEVNGTTYLLEMSLDGGSVSVPVVQNDGSIVNETRTNGVGQPDLGLRLRLLEKTKLTPCADVNNDFSLLQPVARRFVRLFYDDQVGGEFLMHDAPPNSEPDATAGVLDWQDVFAINTNGLQDDNEKPRPFSGKGFEGNYDGLFQPVGFGESLSVTVDELDPFCREPGANEVCQNLKRPTRRHATVNARELDKGDFMPWDWDASHHDAFLTALNPSHGTGEPDNFGQSFFFQDVPDSTLDSLRLRSTFANRPPLLAFGESPLARAINDFRCWYNGSDNDSKCGGEGRPWQRGWRAFALEQDTVVACRRPFLIIISDGEDTTPSGQENASADVGNLFTKSQDEVTFDDGTTLDTAGVQTWVINLGDESGCQGNGELNSIANQGKPKSSKVENCLTVATGPALELTLRRVLGEIKEEARSFATAAVPSVQADEGDKIFLTQFTPTTDAAVWPANVLGFLKPLRTELNTQTDRREPQRTPVCDPDTTEPQSSCFLWDAKDAVVQQARNDARRIYYAQALDDSGPVDGGEWPVRRRLFLDPGIGTNTDGSEPPPTTEELDLWAGLGLATGASDVSIRAARDRVTKVVNATYAVKSIKINENSDGTGGDTIEYVMGDIFHSNPLVIGSPTNTRLFAENFEDYREFARRHENRRRMLVFGSNDAQLHFLDAGTFDRLTDRFTNGTGREIFAYIPRPSLETTKIIANPTAPHQWGVDGTVNAVDAFLDVVHNGTPDPDDREWRTILVGGLRRGGEGYYALDITQPDPLTVSADGLTFTPQDGGLSDSTPEVPGCTAAGSGTGVGGCHPEVGFPATLWEFDDSVIEAGTRVRVDEDGNGEIDLASTWSVPNLGRIEVIDTNGSRVKKFVAIFGGGLDPEKDGLRGNFLYMVDLETGAPIYKARLQGSVPSEPAAVDTNQDGDIDRIYIGTTAGLLYRVDLIVRNADSTLGVPQLETVTVPGTTVQQTRVKLRNVDPDDGTVTAEPWVPRAIFDTTAPKSASDSIPIARPIYFRPTVIFVAQLGEYALAFGTGDREDLWSEEQGEGRFYVFVDETGTLPETADDATEPGQLTENDLPFTESRLTTLGVNDADTSDAILLQPDTDGVRGWHLILNEDERLVTNAFSVSGITVFSAFDPITEGRATAEGPVCSLTGTSRVFGVFTLNGNQLLFDKDENQTRAITLEKTLATEAFIERGQTQNPAQDGPTGDALSAAMQKVMAELMKLFPSNCRFANYRLDIKTITADTGIVHIAPVPVCIVEKNWREL